MQKQPPAPFSCQYTPNLPELLTQLGCTIALTTYQAGKVIFISAKDENNLVQLPRTFNKAMGLAIHGDKMGVATKSEIIVLKNDKRLAPTYPKSPNKYDAIYMPRATYYTGQVDIHDIDWGKDGLWGVNTSFSCLCLVDEEYSFTPKWKPHFITDLASEDRCHLNGLAMENGGAGHYSRCPHRSRYLMCGSFGIQKKDLLPSYFAAAALLPADKYIIRSLPHII